MNNPKPSKRKGWAAVGSTAIVRHIEVMIQPTPLERAIAWVVCPKCQTIVERQKPTMWLNPQKTLVHIEYGSADLILDRSEALSLAERLPSLVGQMGEIA